MSLTADGFEVFPRDEATARWAAKALEVARPIVTDPAQQGSWLRCAGTWFAGVDVLSNDLDGSVSGVPLAGAALETIEAVCGLPSHWHSGQVSVVYPGYPKPREGESPGAAAYRVKRDAAHVDGLLPVGPERRRMLREPHAFILGLPLTETDPEAAPLVAWRGSHRVMSDALGAVLRMHPVADWANVDLTEAYSSARKLCFETCERVPLPVRPGEATLLDRRTLHGIAPWADGAVGPDEGRMIAYFRPEMTEIRNWP